MSAGGEQLLSVLAEQVADAVPVVLASATVVSVRPGAARDGGPLLTVRWRGADVPVPYLATYSPVAGHVVALLVADTRLLVLGRSVGTP